MSSDALFISCRGAHAEYNVEDRTNDRTKQILTCPGAHRGVQVCGSDLLGPRRRPPKAGHSPPPRLRCCQRRRQRLWREGAASGEAFLQRHGSQWLAAGAVTSWRGRCGAPPTAAAGMSGASTGIPQPLRLRARTDRRQDHRRKGMDTWVCSHAKRSVRICCATMYQCSSLCPRSPLTTV